MTQQEREVLQDAVDRLSLLLERVNFEGSVELYQEIESVVTDLSSLLTPTSK